MDDIERRLEALLGPGSRDDDEDELCPSCGGSLLSDRSRACYCHYPVEDRPADG